MKAIIGTYFTNKKDAYKYAKKQTKLKIIIPLTKNFFMKISEMVYFKKI